MPNIKSAKKRVKVAAVKAAKNKACKSALKTAVKSACASISVGDGSGAEKTRLAVKKIDQAVSKGIIHKNSAARKKSALARKLNVKSS